MRLVKTKIFLLSLIISVIFIYGCSDPCADQNCSDCGGSGRANIFFWAVTLNNDTPCIYTISPNGGSYRQIIENGQLYSQPSDNGQIVFLRNQKNESTGIIKANIDGTGQRVIIDTVFFKDGLSYPLISPDGNTIAFIDRNDKLYVYDETYLLSKATLMKGSLPSFSPDRSSLLIAFFEGSALKGPVTVKVMNYRDQSNSVMFSREYPDGFDISQGLLQPAWSFDGSKLAFSLKTDTSCLIHIVDIFGEDEKIIDVSSIGAAMPIFSPNSDIILFTAGDGRLCKSDVGKDAPLFWFLTPKDSASTNKYAQWSSDGKSIVFSNFPVDYEINQLAGLFILDGSDDTGSSKRILLNYFFSINNFTRSFWGR